MTSTSALLNFFKKLAPPRLFFKKDNSPLCKSQLDWMIGLGAKQDASGLAISIKDPCFLSLVCPVYNTDPHYLDDLLASFKIQNAPWAELILVDDASTSPATILWLENKRALPQLKIIRSTENGGIAVATNKGIDAASGTYLGFIDHDDVLMPFALQQIAKTLTEFPECAFLYTDEVVTDKTLAPQGFFFKPAWDPVLHSGVNYTNHLSIYARARVLSIGGLRTGLDGSQDYDFVLRFTKDLDPRHIVHLPYPAYGWRRDGGSYSAQYLDKSIYNARIALSNSFSSDDANPVPVGPSLVHDLHRVRFDAAQISWPRVSIIIPNINAFSLISRLTNDIFNKTDYPNIEVILVDNGSTDTRVLALYDTLKSTHPNFSLIYEKMEFNFSTSINYGLAAAKGDILLLLNNDIEITDPHWLTELVSCFQYKDVGIVGCKLLYPDRTTQHLGVIAGFGGLAGHWYMNSQADFYGPMNRFAVRQSLSVVTGACLAISRECHEAVGTFDALNFAIAYNDVDYCLRARKLGFGVVFTPFTCLIHHESATRGSDEASDKIARFRREQDALRRVHGTDHIDDPAISPWMSKDKTIPDFVALDQLPPARTNVLAPT